MPNKEYRYTKYFWLVNLNQKAYTKKQADYFARLLEQAVLHVFTSGDVVAFAAEEGPRWNRNYIGNNMLQIHIELGPKMSRIHAHVIQEIKHRTTLNIDQEDARDAINDYISERTGGRVEKCFVSKKVHPSAMPLEEYADKDNKDWKNTGEVPSIHSTYILEIGGKSNREEIELEEEEEYLERMRLRQNVIIDLPISQPLPQLPPPLTADQIRALRKAAKPPKSARSMQYGSNSRRSVVQMASSNGQNSNFPQSATSGGRAY